MPSSSTDWPDARNSRRASRMVEADADLADQPAPAPLDRRHRLLGEDLVAGHAVDEPAWRERGRHATAGSAPSTRRTFSAASTAVQRGGLHRDELRDPVAGQEDAVGDAALERRLRAPAPGRGERAGVVPDLHPGLGDVPPHLRVHAVEVGQERVAHRVLGGAEQRARAPAAAVDHDHAALLGARAVHEVGVVEEHVEAQVGREHGVEVVPRHRRGLVGVDAEHCHRPEA